jgi:hypothetical protein
MTLKTIVKHALLGRPGLRPRHIPRGLLRGLQFQIDTAAKSQRLLGLEEAEISDEVASMAARARVALDIGANDGWYALYFASRPNIERVLAFEPVATLRERLLANFALNDPAWTAKLTCSPRLVGNRRDDNYCRVDEVPGDLARPVLLKIDVDGAELEVLEGARGLLASGHCLLVVETHSRELEEGCLGLLSGLGYRCRVVRHGWYRTFLPEARQLAHNRWLVARWEP